MWSLPRRLGRCRLGRFGPYSQWILSQNSAGGCLRRRKPNDFLPFLSGCQQSRGFHGGFDGPLERLPRGQENSPDSMSGLLLGFFVVGAGGFEPPTPCTPCRCATGLRYAPRVLSIPPPWPGYKALYRCRQGLSVLPAAQDDLRGAMSPLPLPLPLPRKRGRGRWVSIEAYPARSERNG